MKLPVIFTIAINLVLLSFLIVGAVKYALSGYSFCNLIYFGHIKSLESATGTFNDKTISLAELLFEIYTVRRTDTTVKLFEGQLKYVESYKMITTAEISAKYNLRDFYTNSSLVKLYKNCFSINKRRYYLEDIKYFDGGAWQAVMVISSFLFTLSLFGTAFFMIEEYYEKKRKREERIERMTMKDFGI